MTKVYIADSDERLQAATDEILNSIKEEKGSILKNSGEVYIKVNGIDFKKHCYTSPLVLKAVIKYFNKIGASKVNVMENSTQSNMTRIVFAINGYKKICKKHDADLIYLDEEESETYEFKGKPSDEVDPKGYKLKTLKLPKTIVKIMKNRENVTYINLPKLKTHSMAVVTLGIKNQWGFPQHESRGIDHNYNLHGKLVDVYEYIQPDITLIDGTEGTIHGHYPPTAFEDELVIPFNILIGGTDTLSVDVVGARIFGLTLKEIPHLRIAYERGLGEGDLENIEVVGKDLSQYDIKYDWDLLQKFPENIKIVKGKKLLCKEGCQNNPLALLQVLAYDYPEKFQGNWFLVMGKGHDEDIADKLMREGYKKGLVAGDCAIEEVGEKLRKRFGKKQVFYSDECNNLAKTATALFKLSGVSSLDLIKGEISLLKMVFILISAKLHGSKARIPSII
ncbi:MAG: DUF362 domain-containing protein [Promethearchaeia archaeon]